MQTGLNLGCGANPKLKSRGLRVQPPEAIRYLILLLNPMHACNGKLEYFIL